MTVKHKIRIMIALKNCKNQKLIFNLNIKLYHIRQMSFEKEVEIYCYTLTILNLTLKVKFPCKIYLEHQSNNITSEVQSTNNHKFIFNQEVSLKNQTEKDYIELVVQLLTEKGAKYVGGVIKLSQTQLIGSQGECMAVPITKCLDSQAFCQIRVDQVATSRVVKKGSPKRRQYLKSQYNPDLVYSNLKPRMHQEGQTKSQFNLPISISRKEYLKKPKDQMGIGNVGKKFKGNESAFMDREVANGGTLSVLQFEVYKQGYNKLKDKFRKQTEVARTEMNKRIALESNQNNLKLQSMRFKLKSEELEKTLTEKNQKIKELSESIAQLQKKELDSKYLKQQLQNKNYTIKSLQETVKSLSRDNNELKNMQNQIYQNQQESIQNLKDYIDKIKVQFEIKENEWTKELKAKNDIISKRQYQLQNKYEELERAKCNIEDIEKNLSNKTFQMEKAIQNERNTAKNRIEEIRDKLSISQSEKAKLSEKLSVSEHSLQQKKSQLTKMEYDRKVMAQNNQILNKENQQLRAIKQKYTELSRQYQVTLDEKNQLEKTKQKEIKTRDMQVNQLNQKLKLAIQNNKKVVRDQQEKLKASQLRCIEQESQIQSLRNQCDKLKRQSQSISKELTEAKNNLRQKSNQIKAKEGNILQLTNQLSNLTSKHSQGQNGFKLQIKRLREQADKSTQGWAVEQSKVKQYSEKVSQLQLVINKTKMQSHFRQQKTLKELNYSKQKISTLEAIKTDLQSQISSLNININHLKNTQKNNIEKIQKLELQSIKSNEGSQKLKKDIKIYEQKIQINQNNLKSKVKEISELLSNRQKLQKRINQLEGIVVGLKSQLSRQLNQKQRQRKIIQILQADTSQSKQQQNRLTSIIASKQEIQASLRQQIKKEKEEYTKLDLKLNNNKKQFDKFRQSLIDNINTVFLSIPTGLNGQRQNRSIVIQKSSASHKDNSQIINLLITLGRETRTNFVQSLQQLKQAIRDNQKLNSDYSLSVNKRNATQFEYNQNITALQQEIAELMEEKTKQQNKYQQQIFLLQGKIKENQQQITLLVEQSEELQFLVKNTKNEFDLHKEENFKKDQARNRLIEDLREQNQNLRSQIDVLEKTIQNIQQALEAKQLELEECQQVTNKLNKEIGEAKQSIEQFQNLTSSLKKELKKSNQQNDELTMNLNIKTQQYSKVEEALKQEERKGTELRQFLKSLIKQKESIIKIELEKSERVLQLQTSAEEMKHQIESLEEQIKKYRLTEEQQKEIIRKLNKSGKEDQIIKAEEKAKVAKLSQRLREKQKQGLSKDQTIARLEERLKRQLEKKTKNISQLQGQIDIANNKLLSLQRQNSQKILSLQNIVQKLQEQKLKLTEVNISTEENVLKQKNRSEDFKQRLQHKQQELIQSQKAVKEITSKIEAMNEEMRIQQENTYKLQGRINLFQMKFEMKQNENLDKIQNLNEDWTSKYYSMEQQFQQRLELIEKEKQFLQEKLAQSQKTNKKLMGDIKSNETNLNNLTKHFEEKIRLVEEDRLTAISQKNIQNQRLSDQVHANFEALKLKESEHRKLHNQYEMAKINLAKMEHRCKQSQQKIRNLNKALQSQSQQFKRKQQNFKKVKQALTNSIWKSQREVRKLLQSSTRQIIELSEQKSTLKVMQISRALEQGIISAISIKMEERQN